MVLEDICSKFNFFLLLLNFQFIASQKSLPSIFAFLQSSEAMDWTNPLLCLGYSEPRTLLTCSRAAHLLLFSRTGPFLVTYKVWWREITNLYMFCGLPPSFAHEQDTCAATDGKAQSRVQHVWTSGPSIHLQWRTSGPEHSSQALLGSTAVKTQTI